MALRKFFQKVSCLVFVIKFGDHIIANLDYARSLPLDARNALTACRPDKRSTLSDLRLNLWLPL
jgi:hypothetical protein